MKTHDKEEQLQDSHFDTPNNGGGGGSKNNQDNKKMKTEKEKLSGNRGFRRFLAVMAMGVIWGVAFSFAYKYELTMPITVVVAPIVAYFLAIWAEQDKDPRDGIFPKNK